MTNSEFREIDECKRWGEKQEEDFHKCKKKKDQQEEELPTAGYSYKTVNEDGEKVWATNKLNPEMGNIQVKEKHELVRRKDHLEDKLMTLQFALEAYNKNDKEALKKKKKELQENVLNQK